MGKQVWDYLDRSGARSQLSLFRENKNAKKNSYTNTENPDSDKSCIILS